MLKAVILIGGPQKGTRFRPLSLDVPKPLFPIAGLPMIQHHIEACARMKDEIREVLLIGFYPKTHMESFVEQMKSEYKMNIQYLEEYAALGTAGGMYNFRDIIQIGSPKAVFVMNGDICANFSLQPLYEFHNKQGETALITIMTTEATRLQSINYGCLVLKSDGVVDHYVEKPSSYVSAFINCGVYVCSTEVFTLMTSIFQSKERDYTSTSSASAASQGHMQWEKEVLSPLAGTGRLFGWQCNSWWSQIKNAGSAIYANRHYLELYRKTHPERLAQFGFPEQAESKTTNTCTIIPDVYIHPKASVHPTAVLGPNVSIGAGVIVGPGVRIRESIILENAVIRDHTLILHSIVGRGSEVGEWARVEGTPSDPDPNKPFAKMENPPLFNNDGRLNPSITILGCSVVVPSESIVLNSIVLPNKKLTRNFKNEIIL